MKTKNLILSAFALIVTATACDKDPVVPPVVKPEEEQIIFSGNQIGSGIQELKSQRAIPSKREHIFLRDGYMLLPVQHLRLNQGLLLREIRIQKQHLLLRGEPR